MTRDTLINRAMLLLIIPLAGMVGLYTFELAHVIGEPDLSADDLPPAALIIGVVCFSVLPVLILATLSNTVLRWLALVMTVLLALFHLLHIVEHVMISDWALTALILFTMFLPSVLGAICIWRAKPE